MDLVVAGFESGLCVQREFHVVDSALPRTSISGFDRGQRTYTCGTVDAVENTTNNREKNPNVWVGCLLSASAHSLHRFNAIQ